MQVTGTCHRCRMVVRSSVSSTRCSESHWRWSSSRRSSSGSWSSRRSCTTRCWLGSARHSASSTFDWLTSSSSSASSSSSSFSFRQPSSPSSRLTGTSSMHSTTASYLWRRSDWATTSPEICLSSRSDRSIRSVLHVSNARCLPHS